MGGCRATESKGKTILVVYRKVRRFLGQSTQEVSKREHPMQVGGVICREKTTYNHGNIVADLMQLADRQSTCRPF